MNIHFFPNQKFIENFVKEVKLHCDVSLNKFIVRETGPFLQASETYQFVTKPREIQNMLDQLGPSDVFVIHFIDRNVLNLLPKLHWKCKLAWVFWGAEFYKILHYTDKIKLFDKDTQNIYTTQRGRKIIGQIPGLHKVFQTYNRFIYRKYYDTMKTFMTKLDYVYHFNKFDFQLIKENFKTNAQLKLFSYANFSHFINQQTKEDLQYTTNDNLILLGNSGSLTNNHIDIFKKLPAVNNQIIIPLGYGKPYYIENLKSYFSDKKNVTLLTEFMPLDEYNRLLSNVSFCFMGHNRAEGVGNIHVLIFTGKKLFLKPHTTAYQYLKNLGIAVFDINSPNLEAELSKPLSKEEIARNRQNLINFQGYDKLIHRYQLLFN